MKFLVLSIILLLSFAAVGSFSYVISSPLGIKTDPKCEIQLDIQALGVSPTASSVPFVMICDRYSSELARAQWVFTVSLSDGTKKVSNVKLNSDQPTAAAFRLVTFGKSVYSDVDEQVEVQAPNSRVVLKAMPKEDRPQYAKNTQIHIESTLKLAPGQNFASYVSQNYQFVIQASALGASSTLYTNSWHFPWMAPVVRHLTLPQLTPAKTSLNDHNWFQYGLKFQFSNVISKAQSFVLRLNVPSHDISGFPSIFSLGQNPRCTITNSRTQKVDTFTPVYTPLEDGLVCNWVLDGADTTDVYQVDCSDSVKISTFADQPYSTYHPDISIEMIVTAGIRINTSVDTTYMQTIN